MITVIDGNDDVVLRKQVHFVGPPAHYFVSLFGAFRRGQTGVKHAVKHMDGGHLRWGELSSGEMFDLQIDEVIVQVFLRCELLQIAFKDCDGVLEKRNAIEDEYKILMGHISTQRCVFHM